MAGVSVSGNNLTKTAATGWGNAGAASTQTITSGDGYMEFTATETNKHRMAGLSNSDSNQDYNDIDYSLYLTAGGTIEIYEGGTLRGSYGAYAVGDVVRVAVEGGVVKYRKNGTLLYSSTSTPAYPLLVDTCLYDTGATLTNVIISGASDGGSSATVKWLVADHLGTPRMVFDQTGSLANVSRHDYLPFGEELFAGTGGRTTAQGYTSSDNVRQKFTSKERDDETGLDYFLARYYSSTQGRFTSVDSEGAGARESEPQSWNGYAYAGGNPVLFTDPDGREYLVCDSDGKNCRKVSDEDFYEERRAFEKTGNTYTGSRDFFESGEIKNAEGGVVAAYVQISIDDPRRQFIFAMRNAVDPIPRATLQFFGLSVVLGTGGGALAYSAPGALPFIAPAVQKLSVTGPSVGITLLSQAQNPSLRNVINSLYKATARVGSGSTADAIRFERATGKLLSPAGHSIKGRESIRALEGLIRSGKLNPAETNIAKFLVNDLKDALK